MTYRSLCVLFVGSLLSLAGCGESGNSPTDWRDPSPHSQRYIVVNGVRLHVLDWGGAGHALVLIPGSGDNPHVFDAIAPHLSDRFHVVSYARRENGRSERRGPYDVETLVEDLRQLLDARGFTEADFAGWSLGGHELTRFAGLYPTRVGKLVYLDAAYDWSAPERREIASRLPAIGGWAPSSSDLRTFTAYKRWFTETSVWRSARWSPAVEAYARDLVTQAADGSLRLEPSDETIARWREELSSYRRDYRSVQAPALAIYAASYVPLDEPDRVVGAALEKWTRDEWLSWQRAEAEKFMQGVANARVHQLAGGTHMTFLFTEEREVVRLMRAFLLEATGTVPL